MRETEEALAEQFGLTSAERAELLPSGQQGVFKNRIGWERAYLKKAGLIEAPKRAVFKISACGQEVFASKPMRIDSKYLERWPEFLEFRDFSKDSAVTSNVTEPTQSSSAPEEALEGYTKD